MSEEPRDPVEEAADPEQDLYDISTWEERTSFDGLAVGVYNLMGGTRFVQEAITGLGVAPIVVLAFMMLILLVLGMFMDWIGIALLTMPIFVPVVEDLGYSPVWFGILFAMNMQVSYITPPFGPAAFYLKSVAPPEISLADIFASLWPFILLQLCGLAIVLFFPEIAMWLPEAVNGR
jgi:TRAP-type mannitol/chloroaromatic compound transport system permease large subunit